MTLTGNSLGQSMVFARGCGRGAFTPLNAAGHGSHLSLPEETVDAVKAWL